MTNKELIAILQQHDPEAIIEVQCWSYYYPIKDVAKLTVDAKYGDQMLIIRLNESEDF